MDGASNRQSHVLLLAGIPSHRRNSSAYHTRRTPGDTQICWKKSHLEEGNGGDVTSLPFQIYLIDLSRDPQAYGEQLIHSPRGISAARPVACLTLPRRISHTDPLHLSVKMPFLALESIPYNFPL